MRTHPGEAGIVIGRVETETKRICLEGEAGLLVCLDSSEVAKYNASRGDMYVRHTNGAVCYVASADVPDSVRGYNLSRAWCDELAQWRYAEKVWDEALLPALRKGDARIVVTTTPQSNRLLRRLLDDESTVATRGSTWDNAANLSSTALDGLRRRYEGTRLGRQELEGELLTDVPGALWTPALLDLARTDRVPQLARVTVAVDPAVTSGDDADDTGIIVAGLGVDGVVYVLADYTCHLPPRGWARRALAAFDEHQADRVVAEVNNGGDMVEHVLRSERDWVPYRTVHASRGKRVRAEPVASLYGDPERLEDSQPRVRHVRSADLAHLEDELCTWTPESGDSPDRLDALVWAVWDLVVDDIDEDRIVEWNDPVTIGADL